MFVKFWAIGNGGLKGYETVAFISDFNIDDELYEEDVDYYIERVHGPLSYGVRSVHYEVIDKSEVTDKMIEKEIAEHEYKIKNAEDIIRHIKKYREEIK